MLLVFVVTFPLIVAILPLAVVTLPLTVSTFFSTLDMSEVNDEAVCCKVEMFVAFVSTLPLTVPIFVSRFVIDVACD